MTGFYRFTQDLKSGYKRGSIAGFADSTEVDNRLKEAVMSRLNGTLDESTVIWILTVTGSFLFIHYVNLAHSHGIEGGLVGVRGYAGAA